MTRADLTAILTVSMACSNARLVVLLALLESCLLDHGRLCILLAGWSVGCFPGLKLLLDHCQLCILLGGWSVGRFAGLAS